MCISIHINDVGVPDRGFLAKSGIREEKSGKIGKKSVHVFPVYFFKLLVDFIQLLKHHSFITRQ